MGRIVVNHRNFKDALEHIKQKVFLGLDTETTGLRPYKGHRLFSLIISTEENDYYFNFNATPDHLGNIAPVENILPKSWLDDFTQIFENEEKVYFIHNAKFDWHMLYVEGLVINGKVYCTQMMSRLINNRLVSYSLANVAVLIGLEKDNTVEAYIMKHKLYTDVDVGKKKPRRDKHYDLVPFKTISEYGLTDGRVVYKLGMYCFNRIQELGIEQVSLGLPDVRNVLENEVKLTRTLFKVEARGIKIDRPYCEEAYKYEVSMYEEVADKFYALTEGIEFEDAAKCFKAAFQKLGLEAGKTPKGNDSYSEANLPDNPVTELILQYRKHYKRAHTYFKNFLELAGDDDILHCTFNQAGTATGRLSSSNPNLQNVPKRGEDDAKYPVRKVFVPREGYIFAMQDADAGEYKLLIDIANEKELIKKINDGLDVHTATAEEMQVERTPAKTLNFLLLYGGGAQKLADALKVTLSIAKGMKQKYFVTLPSVQSLVNGIKQVSKTRGYVVNWLGRRLYCGPNEDYKMPNHYIQGGLGDIVKVAMNNVDEYINDARTDIHILLNIHDEILYEIPEKELYEMAVLENILVQSYPWQNLMLTWGTDIGKNNWYEKEKYNG